MRDTGVPQAANDMPSAAILRFNSEKIQNQVLRLDFDKIKRLLRGAILEQRGT